MDFDDFEFDSNLARVGNSLFRDGLVNWTRHSVDRTVQEQDMIVYPYPVNQTSMTGQSNRGREPAGSLFQSNPP
ncbi:hypothetical protein TIFTF001_018735 [Ficus carica]|uniref:Uncharacterized protein n=1 Tax=Ficus carica TaxID=3494 RepID=A0AA88AVW4_FICCA|nr:hypothetical protein TIFTF001_018735 [Ficus carica]